LLSDSFEKVEGMHNPFNILRLSFEGNEKWLYLCEDNQQF